MLWNKIYITFVTINKFVMSKVVRFIQYVRITYNGRIRINFQGDIYVKSEDIFSDSEKSKKFIKELRKATIAYNNKVNA